MILPEGTVVFRNLTSTMVEVGEIFAELEKRELTGYVAATADNFSGTIFLRKGAFVDAIEEVDSGTVVIGEPACADIIKRCRSGDVGLDVGEVSDAVLNALIGFVNNRTVYENMSSEFVNIDKLLLTLETWKHTGCIEIVTRSGTGTILFENGFFIDGTFKMANGTTIIGIESLEAIINAYRRTAATINVYRPENMGCADACADIPIISISDFEDMTQQQPGFHELL